jgi:hypothetical protein
MIPDAQPPAPVILYPGRHGRPDFALRVDGQTVWLTQAEMAELYGTTTANINIHIRNILNEKELHSDSVLKESLITAADGKNYRTKLYRLEVVLAVGYRVRSRRGTEFRPDNAGRARALAPRWGATVFGARNPGHRAGYRPQPWARFLRPVGPSALFTAERGVRPNGAAEPSPGLRTRIPGPMPWENDGIGICALKGRERGRTRLHKAIVGWSCSSHVSPCIRTKCHVAIFG